MFVTKRDLEKLAQSVSRGFADVDHDFVYLRQEIRDNFSEINATLNDHMGDVREQTDNLANRVKKLEQVHEGILKEINSAMVGQEVEILVEGRRKGKWQGRTRSNKLVFFQGEGDYLGELVNLNINRASPWSLQGELVSGLSDLAGRGN